MLFSLTTMAAATTLEEPKQISSTLLGCKITFEASEVYPTIPIASYVSNATKLKTLVHPRLVNLPQNYTVGSHPNCKKLKLKDHSKGVDPTLVTAPNVFVNANKTACADKAIMSHFMFQITDETGKLNELNLYYVCPTEVVLAPISSKPSAKNQYKGVLGGLTSPTASAKGNNQYVASSASIIASTGAVLAMISLL